MDTPKIDNTSKIPNQDPSNLSGAVQSSRDPAAFKAYLDQPRNLSSQDKLNMTLNMQNTVSDLSQETEQSSSDSQLHSNLGTDPSRKVKQ